MAPTWLNLINRQMVSTRLYSYELFSGDMQKGNTINNYIGFENLICESKYKVDGANFERKLTKVIEFQHIKSKIRNRNLSKKVI